MEHRWADGLTYQGPWCCAHARPRAQAQAAADAQQLAQLRRYASIDPAAGAFADYLAADPPGNPWDHAAWRAWQRGGHGAAFRAWTAANPLPAPRSATRGPPARPAPPRGEPARPLRRRRLLRRPDPDPDDDGGTR